jgi:hypothetical protein
VNALRVYRERQTYRSLAWLLLQLPLAVVDFTVAALAITVPLAGIVGVVAVAAGGEAVFGPWHTHDAAAALAVAVSSLLALPFGGKLVRWWTPVSRRVGSAVLGPDV